MKCPRCQQDAPSDADFCPECGTKLAVVCGGCGTTNAPTHKFCKKCGQGLGVGSGPSQAGVPSTSPSSYTPKHLAERIINSKAALEGERKQVTVLFADLKGSMELLADRDPEEARKLLDPVIEHMMEAVHRYEGTVNQVMGDGIMALFGAPLAHEDHAIRACYAALRMQDSVKRCADGIFRSHGVPVEIRVGLNSGEVVVRAIGSDLHMDYTAVGQTTHLAARMEQMARPGTVLLAPETLALAQGFVQVSSRGPVPVKGLGEPIEIFELSGVNPVRSRLHATATRGLTRFVGRDAELELLRQALGRAGQGQGQVVAIVGEPGVGKSRLVWEFTHSHRSQDWLVLEAASVSYGKATTYYPVVELLRRYFQIEARDDHRKVREKITGKLLSLDRALEPTVPVFLSLLDVPIDDAEWAKLDPPQRRRRTLDAVKWLLVRESQVQPVLLVFEDLHWIDGETQAFLDTLVDSVPMTRLLLLVNYRPEYTHSWGSKTYYQQLRLDTLPPISAGEFLEALLGPDPTLADLRRLLIDRTQGNPFFLEETVHALVETGALTGERGSYRLAAPIQNLRLPSTVQTILAARIDRLDPEDKRVLQAAAVIGKEVPFTLLQAVAEESEEGLRRGILRLQAGEFLYETRLFPDGEYTFKHALTLETAYGGLLRERAEILHARVVSAIERLFSERLDGQFERLAYHAEKGGLADKAVRYYREAGARAAVRYAYREASICFERAIMALAGLPRTVDTMQRAIDLRFELRNSLLAFDDPARILQCLREAETDAEILGDQQRLGRIYSYVSRSLWQRRDHLHAIEAGRKALGLAASLGDLGLRVSTNFYLGLIHYSLGNYADAAASQRDAIASIDRDLAYERFALPYLDSVFSRAWLVAALAEQGRFSEAMTCATEAIRLADGADLLFDRAAAHWGLGVLQVTQGELVTAIPELDRSLSFCRLGDLPRWHRTVSCWAGYARVLVGRPDEALEAFLNSENVKSGESPLRARFLLFCGEAWLRTDRQPEALDLARRGLAEACDRGERGHEAYALRLLGNILDANGDVTSAEEHYHRAMVLGALLGMRPLIAHCHLGLGKLYAHTDKREQARDQLSTAATMYREMEMRFWLAQAEAEQKA